jgi:hypothetical protein
MASESLINKLQKFLTDNDIKIEQDLLSTSLRELNFTQTLSLIDNLKVNDKNAVLELLNINAPVTEEADDVYTTDTDDGQLASTTMHGLLDKIENYYHEKNGSDELDVQIGDDDVFIGNDHFNIYKNNEDLGDDLYNELEQEDIAAGRGPVTEEGSPWTTTGKHPEDMDADELRDELAVFDELRDRGDYLSPKELAREDTLFDYLEQIDGPQVQYEAYGTVGTQQPSASTIKAQTTKDNNNQRDFTNDRQDQQRDVEIAQRTVAGGNKQATGQGAARSVGADPDDVQRGQNAAQSNANAQLSNQNAQEIERLKQLAYGRR